MLICPIEILLVATVNPYFVGMTESQKDQRVALFIGH